MENIFYETVLMKNSFIQHYQRRTHDKNSGLADEYKYYAEYARSNGEMHTVMTSQDIYYRWVKGQKANIGICSNYGLKNNLFVNELSLDEEDQVYGDSELSEYVEDKEKKLEAYTKANGRSKKERKLNSDDCITMAIGILLFLIGVGTFIVDFISNNGKISELTSNRILFANIGIAALTITIFMTFFEGRKGAMVRKLFGIVSLIILELFAVFILLNYGFRYIYWNIVYIVILIAFFSFICVKGFGYEKAHTKLKFMITRKNVDNGSGIVYMLLTRLDDEGKPNVYPPCAYQTRNIAKYMDCKYVNIDVRGIKKLILNTKIPDNWYFDISDTSEDAIETSRNGIVTNFTYRYYDKR